MAKIPSEAAAQRRERILDAAQELLLRNGFRGTSMEAIAKAGGVAKPTLYAYFPDKQAVFDAAARRFLGTLETAAMAALGEEAGAVQRVANALAAKHKLVFRLLEGSPHAAEIYAVPKRGDAGLEAVDARLGAAMREVLVAGGYAQADRMLPILKASADGIARNATRAEEIGPAIRLVADKLFA